MSRSESLESQGTAADPIPLSNRRKLLVLCSCALMGLLLCEGAVRLRAWYLYGFPGGNFMDALTEYDAELGIRVPRAGLQRRASKTQVSINTLGFRGAEFPREKPPGTLRIVCLGESHTFCTGASSDENTWPHQLELGLQAQHPELSIQVINAGVPKYLIEHSLKSLEQRILPLDPDLVIVYHANGDISRDLRGLALERGLIEPSARSRSPLIGLVARYSMFVDLLHKNAMILLSRRDDKRGKLKELAPGLPDRFIGELSKLHTTLAERGVPLLLSPVLVKYRREQGRATQISHADVAFFALPWVSIDALVAAQDMYNDAIVRFARSRGIWVLEDRVGVAADDSHYVDAWHLTDAGCRRQAERFVKFFEEQEIIARLRSG